MWIPSKLVTPALINKSIQRNRLLQNLKQTQNVKLVLLQSPAGFGKTTLTAQWLEDKEFTGWYSIDEFDNDPFTFANYFIGALKKATHNHCSKTVALAERNQYGNLKNLFNHFFAEINPWHEPTYLVLDDYHLINNDDIHTAMNYFIKHMPENLTLILTSRTQPPLSIANLRVHCQLLEINHHSLAFDEAETFQFLNQFHAHEFDETTSKKLRDQVEGWPSALQLIALNNHLFNLSSFSQDHNTLLHLWDYLAEEVFDQLDEPMRLFLMQCSVLDRFNHQMVHSVTGSEDALDKLMELNRRGLFLQSLDADGKWYRFHHLFATFLIHQRQRFIPNLENTLYSRAVDAWLTIGNPKQAMSTALSCQDHQLLIDLLLEQGWYLFNHGNMHLLTTALQQLTKEEFYRHWRLVLLRAWLMQTQDQYNFVGDILQADIQEMADRNVILQEEDSVELNALLAQVAINKNDPEEALRLSEQVFEKVSSNSYHSRIVATSITGEVHHNRGQLSRALSLMQQTEKLAYQYQIYPQALWSLVQQSEIYNAQGATQLSTSVLEKAEALVKNKQLEQITAYRLSLHQKSQMLWRLHQLEDAEALAKRIRELSSQAGNLGNTIPAYTMLTKIALVRGELDKAQRYLTKCLHLLVQGDYHLDWQANIAFCQLILWQIKDNKTQAAEWLETAEHPTSATNHFAQLQLRNIARAHMICGNLDAAQLILLELLSTSRELKLVLEEQQNLSLLGSLHETQGNKSTAEQHTVQAIELSIKTGATVYFYLTRSLQHTILSRVVKQEQIDLLIRHQARTLLTGMGKNHFSRAVHFDEELVQKLISSERLPNALKASPLTLREWQVLGLIYSGYSNEQISAELDVATTTIKTHIRNLYQKLQVNNREQAIRIADSLIKNIH